MECQKTLSSERMHFALDQRGQFVYAYGDMFPEPYTEREIRTYNYSLCQVGIGLAFVSVSAVQEQIRCLKEHRFSDFCPQASSNLLIPHPPYPDIREECSAELFDFFRYEKDEYGKKQLVWVAQNLEGKTYSLVEAARILGCVSVVKVKDCGKSVLYYVSEASRLIAETFMEQRWCVRAVGLRAKIG